MSDQENTNMVTLDKALQEARLKASLSVEEVAIHLNLAISMIRDIEDDLTELIDSHEIPNIYLRGYLVNYAKMVNLENLDQFSEFQMLSSSDSSYTHVQPSVKSINTRSLSKKLLLVFFLFLILSGIAFVIKQVFFNGDNVSPLSNKEVTLEVKDTPVVTTPMLVVKKKVVK